MIKNVDITIHLLLLLLLNRTIQRLIKIIVNIYFTKKKFIIVYIIIYI